MDDQTRALALAVGAYIFRFTAGLLIFENQSVNVGSGTCIKIGERFFIATAAHNLSGFRDDQIAIARSTRISSDFVRFLARHSTSGDSSDLIDLGWIELNSSDAKNLGKDFLSLDDLELGVSHRSQSKVVVAGHPADRVDQEQFPLINLECVTLMCNLLLPSQASLPKNADRDVVVDYQEMGVDSKSGRAFRTPPANGLSGGGIWLVSMESSGVWDPSSTRLIAVERSWDRATRQVFGTQIQHWLMLLRASLPELQESLDPRVAQFRRT